MSKIGKNILKSTKSSPTIKKLSDAKAKKYFEDGQLIIATSGTYKDGRITSTSESTIKLIRKDNLLDNVAVKGFNIYGKKWWEFQPWLLDFIECYSIKKQGKRPVKYYLTPEKTKKLIPILEKLTKAEAGKKDAWGYEEERYGFRFMDLPPKDFYTALEAGIKMGDIDKLP